MHTIRFVLTSVLLALLSAMSRRRRSRYPPKRRNTHAEGTEICDWITKQGVTCVVLKYRMPQTWRHDRVEKAPKVQLPLQDARRAIGLLRHQASSSSIDPHEIGVIGRPRIWDACNVRSHHHEMAEARGNSKVFDHNNPLSNALSTARVRSRTPNFERMLDT